MGHALRQHNSCELFARLGTKNNIEVGGAGETTDFIIVPAKIANQHVAVEELDTIRVISASPKKPETVDWRIERNHCTLAITYSEIESGTKRASTTRIIFSVRSRQWG